jgi:hypothetical protein
MTVCTHERTRQITEWGPFQPAEDGWAESRKIEQKYCAQCGKPVGRPKVRATIRRGIIQRDAPSPLRHPQEQVRVLEVLLENAQPKNGRWTVTRGGMNDIQDLPNQGELNVVLETLAHDGLLALERTFSTGARHETRAIHWDPQQYESLTAHFGIEPPDDPLDGLTEALRTSLKNTPTGPREDSLRDVWQSQLAGLEAGHAVLKDIKGETITTSRQRARYARLVRATIAIGDSFARRELVPYRTLSTRATQDSKLLDPEQGTLEELLGQPLEDFGIILHDELVRVSGPITVTGSDGFRVEPGTYVVGISRGIVASGKWSTSARQLIVAENLTIFESLARDAARANQVKLWSAGRPSRTRLQAVMKLASAGTNTVETWADLDPYGIQIAETIRQACDSIGATWRPHRMDIATFDSAPTRKPLTPAARQLVIKMTASSAWYAPLARRMLETDSWVEQEALL